MVNDESRGTVVSPVLAQRWLDVAVEAARFAGRHTLTYFRTGTPVELKSDRTPVTKADREAEHIAREYLHNAFPDHTILGEEHGTLEGDPDFTWIIDPIDGTKSFIHGVPLYGTLVGLMVRGRPTVGVIYLPVPDETISAAIGHGCYFNGTPTKVSGVDRLEDALVLASEGFLPASHAGRFETLARRCRYVRTWGDAYGYAMVATGRAEVMADATMSPWDCAAIIPVLQEAGGWCSSWAGEVSIDRGDLMACNRALADEVRRILAGNPS